MLCCIRSAHVHSRSSYTIIGVHICTYLDVYTFVYEYTHLQLLTAFLRHVSNQRLVGMRNGQSIDGCRYAPLLWVCIHIYIYKCIYIYVCIVIHIYIYIYVYIYMYVYVYNTHVYLYVYIYVFVSIGLVASCDHTSTIIGHPNLCMPAHRDEHDVARGIFCAEQSTIFQTHSVPCRLYLCVGICVLYARSSELHSRPMRTDVSACADMIVVKFWFHLTSTNSSTTHRNCVLWVRNGLMCV